MVLRIQDVSTLQHHVIFLRPGIRAGKQERSADYHHCSGTIFVNPHLLSPRSSTHDHTREGKIKIRDGPKRCHQPIVSQKYTSIGLATVSSIQSSLRPTKKKPLHRQRLMEGNIQEVGH
jgi:hypothetical protein